MYADDGVNDDEEIENGRQTASLISVFQNSKRYRAAKSKPLATQLFTANELLGFFSSFFLFLSYHCYGMNFHAKGIFKSR